MSELPEELKRIAEDRQLLTAFDAWRMGLTEGSILPSGGLFLGKAECEWIGLDGWERIAAAGLVEITIEMKRGKGAKNGGPIKKFRISATDAGRESLKILASEDWADVYRYGKDEKNETPVATNDPR